MADDFDKVMDAMAARAAGPVKREPMTMNEFQHVIDSTPLFMKETPKDGEDNEVMEALKSLMFEGEGDGTSLLCTCTPAGFMRLSSSVISMPDADGH
jgi:hypothetical protein